MLLGTFQNQWLRASATTATTTASATTAATTTLTGEREFVALNLARPHNLDVIAAEVLCRCEGNLHPIGFSIGDLASGRARSGVSIVAVLIVALAFGLLAVFALLAES